MFFFNKQNSLCNEFIFLIKATASLTSLFLEDDNNTFEQFACHHFCNPANEHNLLS